MRRTRGVLLSGVVLAVATLGALVTTGDRSADTRGDMPSASTPSDLRPSPQEVHASVVMRPPTPEGDLELALPTNVFLSVWNPNTGEHSAPRRVRDRRLTIPHTDRSQLARGRRVFYVADDDGVIVDVVVFSNARGGNGRLDPTQWVLSKDGVQLVWDQRDKAPWSVSRGEEELARDAPGIFFDPVSSGEAGYYSMENVEIVTVPPDGYYSRKPTKAEKEWIYVVIVPGHDPTLIGRQVDKVGEQPDPGMRLTARK